MRIASVAVRLALALAVITVLSFATIWLIRPSSAVTLAEKNKQAVAKASPTNGASPDRPNGFVSDPNNPLVQSCPTDYRVCGTKDSYQCCGPREVCCLSKDGTRFCSTGRCPS